jgi:hypothetical protein
LKRPSAHPVPLGDSTVALLGQSGNWRIMNSSNEQPKSPLMVSETGKPFVARQTVHRSKPMILTITTINHSEVARVGAQ